MRHFFLMRLCLYDSWPIFVRSFSASNRTSRATWLTGLHGTQVGITDYIAPIESDAGLGLPPETTTWPQLMPN